VAGSISGRLWYLKLENFVRCHFYGDSVRGKSTAPTIIVSVPTRFRMRGRYRSHFYRSKNRYTGKIKACYTALQQVLCLETSVENLRDDVGFDDARVVLVDNCANTHVWNNLEDFEEGSVKPINRLEGVATIGGSNFYPESVGRLPLSWKDEEGNPFSIVLENVLYFPQSPVNVLSITRLADQLEDDPFGTYIKTGRGKSELVWQKQSRKLMLNHGSGHGLPELVVNQNNKFLVNSSVLAPYDSIDCNSSATVLPEDVIDTN